MKVVIPFRRNIFIIAFLCVWLAFWVQGWDYAIGELVGGEHTGGIRLFSIGIDLFMIVWLILWTFAGAFVLFVILSQIAGKEIITLSGEILKVEKRVLIFGISKSYALSNATRFRVQTSDKSDMWWTLRDFWKIGRGKLAFDYGMNTVRFAIGIDEAEASYILDLFKQKGVRINSRIEDV